MKKMNSIKVKAVGLSALALVVAVSVGITSTGGVANALSATAIASSQARLAVLISKGDQEITRRLTSLNTLTRKINAATKLTASDKATLTTEVSTTISGLSALKTQLDSETTLEAAKTDVANIYSEYRVYALVTPKIALITVADDQQVVQTKLTTLAGKLQVRITTDQQAGKDVTAMQAQLADMNTKISAARAISSAVEAKVITLQPTDYNSDHTILSGYRDQLKSARSDNQAAYSDAKSITATLKTM